MSHILAIDQGTSSSRAVIFNQDAEPLATAQQEFKQYYPQPGWVEHNAMEIWQSQAGVVKKVLQQAKLKPADIAGIGITNQRETTVIWDRKTGVPIHNAIVWQDRRTADICDRLKNAGHEPTIQAKTGLLLDPYFSATKIKWLLNNIEGARKRAEKGELAFGTVDTWLAWNLTRGNLHITDVSNASRTLLFNIEELCWDEELLELFDIPCSLLPAVKTSSEVYGLTEHPGIGSGMPIAAIAGDQQAALFGQLCLSPGMAKCTYGTGSFLMMNTGKDKVSSHRRLLTTVAWQIGSELSYALEGSVFMGGAIIQWLRDGIQLLDKASDVEELAASVSDNGGVYFVPALTGLGAPHWNPYARGAIYGITRGTTQAHIARAALESIAYQVDDLLEAMKLDYAGNITELRIDGGAAGNDLMAQFQADISGIRIARPQNLETTALGAAFLAGLGAGVWKQEDLNGLYKLNHLFKPNLTKEKGEALKKYWKKGVERTMNWIEEA